jgi:lipopolysaccharide export system permease protein
MLIIDRYLLRQFVQIFLICFVSLVGLYVVVDAFANLDAFSAHASQGQGLFAVMSEYYAYRALGFFDRTGGILAMLAAMFTVTWLGRHQELTALLAAGITKTRIIKPLLLAAIVISLVGAANRELVIPRVRDQLMRETKDLGGMAALDLEARYDNQTDILLGGEKVVMATKKIIHPVFVLPAGLSQYGMQLVAKDAIHQDADGNHPAGFLLDQLQSPEAWADRPSLKLRSAEEPMEEGEANGGRPIVITPHDAPWLEPDQVFVVSAMPFQLLASGSKWRNFASTDELVNQLASPTTDLGPEVRVAIHWRLVQPLMDITLVMLGLPLMLSRTNRNLFQSIGICMMAAIAFSVVALVCQSMGGLGLLQPSLAAWLPLMLFIPLAVGMSGALRT